MAAAPLAALRTILIASPFSPMVLSQTAWRAWAPPPPASSNAVRAAQDPQRGLAGFDYRNAFSPRRARKPARPAHPFQYRLRDRRLHRLARGARRRLRDPRRPAAGAAEEPDLDGPALG